MTTGKRGRKEMKQLMEYRILTGDGVMEICRSIMPVRDKQEPRPRRAPRIAGSSSLKKIKANWISSQREAARVINANYTAGDGHLQLKYFTPPTDYDAAVKDMNRYLTQIRKGYKRIRGCNPKLFWVTANWSPRRNAPAALHHHLIVQADCIELARTLWQGGGLSLEHLDNRGDHSALAAYLVDNVHDRPAKKKWHSSRNMEEAIYTEPVPADDVESIPLEPSAVIKEFTVSTDEDGRPIAAYLRCLLPEKPEIKNGRVIMPSKKRRKRKDEARWQDIT